MDETSQRLLTAWQMYLLTLSPEKAHIEAHKAVIFTDHQRTKYASRVLSRRRSS